MSRKNFLILFAVFIFLIALGTVSANDIDDNLDNLTDTSDDIVLSSESSDCSDFLNSVSENNTLSASSGSFNDLQNAINNAASNSLILDQDYVYSSSSDSDNGIVISKSNFILDGNGYKVDGDGKTKIFTITGNNVMLKNITITGGYIDNILTFKSDDTNNYSMGNGAGINWMGTNAHLKDVIVENNFIVNNIVWETTDNKNLKYVIGNGAGVYFDKDKAYIENSVFNNNQIFNSLTQGNTDDTILRFSGYGGAIFFNNGFNVKIYDSNFTKNFADYNGGAIFFINMSNTNINNSNFTNNKASNGGGIYVLGETINSNINSLFYHNNANGDGAGGIYFSGIVNNLNIGGVFNYNSAGWLAGAILFFNNTNNVNISADLLNNIAYNRAGGIEFRSFTSNLIISGKWVNNTATILDGIIRFYNGVTNITLSGTFMDHKTSLILIYGGVSNNVVLSGTFKNLRGYVFHSSSGAVYGLNITGIFENCTSNSVYIDNKAVTNLYINCTYKNNLFAGLGGLFYNLGSTTILGTINGNYVNNKAGSIVCVHADYVNNFNTGDNTVFENNDGLLVGKPITMTLNNFPNSVKTSESLYFKVTVKQNTANVNGVVQILNGNNLLGSISISNGVGETTLANTFSSGSYDIVLKFVCNENQKYSGVSTTQKLNVFTTSTKSFTDLNTAINGNTNKTVYLSGNYTYLSNTDYNYLNGVYLRSNLIIDGLNKTIIDGVHIARIFRSNAITNLTLKNIILTNGFSSEHGGAIRFVSTVNELIIDNCEFINNIVSGKGGSISFAGAVSNLNINSKFRANRTIFDVVNRDMNAFMGGFISFSNVLTNANITGSFIGATTKHWGAACEFNGIVKGLNFNALVENSLSTGRERAALYFAADVSDTNISGLIKNNYAGQQGALRISNLYNATISADFINNSAKSNHGAVHIENAYNVSISGSYINNSADFYYGALAIDYAYNVRVSANFEGNSAVNYAGLYIGLGENVTVEGSDFKNNKAEGISAGLSVSASNTVINNTGFSGNDASMGAGVVLNGGNSVVSNATFNNNSAKTGAGIVSSADGVVISNSSFTNNSASVSGAGLVATGDSTTVEGSEFSGNNATSGGAIVSKGSDFGISPDVTFTNNSAVSDADISSTQNISIRQYLVLDNVIGDLLSNQTLVVSGSLPGTLLSNDYDVYIGTVKVGNLSLFDGNRFSFSCSDLFVVRNVQFNLVTYDGSGEKYSYVSNLFNINPYNTFTVLSSLVTNNSGVLNLCNDFIYYSAYDSLLKDGIVIDKNITINGNGFSINAIGKARIFNIAGDNVTLNNIEFKNAYSNTANGGAIIWAGLYGKLINSNFTNNIVRSTYYGGAVSFNGRGYTISHCIFSNNSATGGSNNQGGAIFSSVANSGSVVEYCVFDSNYAYTYAGALDWYGSVDIKYCNFTNNYITGTVGGGAVLLWSSGSGSTVSYCRFENNSMTATSNSAGGGAIYINQNNVYVRNCDFINNTAIMGGALSWNSANGNLLNSIFVNNSATRGGAVYWTGSNGFINNTKFYNNTASDSGSAIWANKALNIYNSVFLDNLADIDFTYTKTTNGFKLHINNHDNYINAIYASVAPTFSSITYWGSTGKVTSSSTINAMAYHNLTVSLSNRINQEYIGTYTRVTDSYGNITESLGAGVYYDVDVKHYTGFTKYRSILFDIPVDVTVSKLELFVSESIEKGDYLSVVALVNEDAGGNVSFMVNNVLLGVVDIVNGHAYLSVDPKLNVGDYELVALYNGNANYYKQRNTTNFTVKVKSSATISVIAPEFSVNNTDLSVSAKLNFVAPSVLQLVVRL